MSAGDGHPRSEVRRRTAMMCVRFLPTELATARERAAEAGYVSVSGWLRHLALTADAAAAAERGRIVTLARRYGATCKLGEHDFEAFAAVIEDGSEPELTGDES